MDRKKNSDWDSFYRDFNCDIFFAMVLAKAMPIYFRRYRIFVG